MALPPAATDLVGWMSTNNRFTNVSLFDVQQILLNNISETPSVLSFGADPTGVNDSAPAIQAAINSLSSGGGQILFPSGTFKINSTIALANNVTLQGVAGSTVLLGGANMTAMVASGPISTVGPNGSYLPTFTSKTFEGTAISVNVYDPTVANNYNSYGQGVRDMIIDGGATGEHTGGPAIPYGIFFGGAAYFFIDNLLCRNFSAGGHTVSVWNSAFFSVSKIKSYNCDQGVTIVNGCYQFTVDDCSTYDSHDANFACVGGTVAVPYRGEWSNCIGYNSTISSSFDFGACFGQTLTNCQGGNTALMVFNLHANLARPGGHHNLTNCVARGATGGSGFEVSVPRVSLVNCGSLNNSGSGFYIRGSTVDLATDAANADVQLVGCYAVDNANYGALISGIVSSSVNCTLKRVTVAGCNFSDPTNTQLYGVIFQQQFASALSEVTIANNVLGPNNAGTWQNTGGQGNPAGMRLIGNSPASDGTSAGLNSVDYLSNPILVNLGISLNTGQVYYVAGLASKGTVQGRLGFVSGVPNSSGVQGDVAVRIDGSSGARIYYNTSAGSNWSAATTP